MLFLKTLWTFHGVSSWNSCLLSPPPPPSLDCSYIPLFPYQVRSFKVFAVIWYYSLRFLVLVIYIKVLAPQYHCLSFFSFYYYFGGFCIFGKDSMYILPSWFYDLFIYVDSPSPPSSTLLRWRSGLALPNRIFCIDGVDLSLHCPEIHVTIVHSDCG